MNSEYSAEKDLFEELQAARRRKEELQRALALEQNQDLKEEFFKIQRQISSLLKTLQICW
ncbi:MAG: hypothetical protein ACD_56C00045G0002 [uncultured bacterium]|nr:MAG: hypothetical protein ACD_56C00045G0002 [uncultured bacterium]